jgi:hypothetical protein
MYNGNNQVESAFKSENKATRFTELKTIPLRSKGLGPTDQDPIPIWHLYYKAGPA